MTIEVVSKSVRLPFNNSYFLGPTPGCLGRRILRVRDTEGLDSKVLDQACHR